VRAVSSVTVQTNVYVKKGRVFEWQQTFRNENIAL
jgi:hypothetical protein